MVGFCEVCGSMLDIKSGLCPNCGVDETKEEEYIAPTILPADKIKLELFPYEPREIQKRIIADIYDAVSSGKHIVIESGTGTGKTIVSLSGVLRHALKYNKKVIYLTRTISQGNQVMRELKAINTIVKVFGMTLTGRNKSCPLLDELSPKEQIHPSVLATLCEEKKKKSNAGISGGCPYYSKLKSELEHIEYYCKTELPTSDQLDKKCIKMGVCPYEAKKSLSKYMDVIVAPYIHVLSEDIRDGFLGNLESNGSDLCMIIDEAHNIVDAAREQESFSLPVSLCDAAKDEVTTFKADPDIFEGVKLTAFINEAKSAIKNLATSKIGLGKEEEIIEIFEFIGKLTSKFELKLHELDMAIDHVISIGEERTNLLIERGENKISDIYNFGICMNNITKSSPGKFIYSVKTNDDVTSLHAACINPENVTAFIRNIKGAVHMSGTLQPLDQYTKVMNLPMDTVTKTYPSPFPKENKSVIYLGNVTTKYDEMKKDPSIFSRMEKNIAKLCNNVNKNTLVFFTSYSMMSKMRPYLERDVKKEIYWEESKKQKKTMEKLAEFRKGRNGVFFTVMGGSIAEGIDFPGDELCFAIIVGIPYPPPTLELKAMSRMYDEKFGLGTGWRYTSEVPALRKMQQAIGRLIRTDTDRGMAIIFDSRASKYASRLDAKLSTDPLGDMQRFFADDHQDL